jgi:hypothetical protein
MRDGRKEMSAPAATTHFGASQQGIGHHPP